VVRRINEIDQVN